MLLGHPQPPAWPASRDALAVARRFLAALRGRRVLVVPAPDADGLASAVLVVRALEAVGARGAVRVPGKGEQAHPSPLLERVRRANPDALVLLGMGDPGEEAAPGVPTLVVERTAPPAPPPSTRVLASTGDGSDVSTSVLALALVAPLVTPAPLEWLAAVGTVAALGAEAPVPFLEDALRRARRKAVMETVALVNAARRSSRFLAARAQEVLLRARGARDIAEGQVAGVEELRDCRVEVRREVERCARTPPRIAPRAALLLFSSEAQVHSLVARRWESRLPGQVVLAANTGYLPGRVDFTLRGPPSPEVDALLRAHGAQPSGGSLPQPDFLRLAEGLGFRGLRLTDTERRGAFPG